MFLLAFLLTVAGCSEAPRWTTSSPEALGYYTEGVTAWEKFYYREAQESFEKAVKADSGFAVAWGRLAMLHMNSMDESGAKRAAARALALSGGATPREQLLVCLWSNLVQNQHAGAARVADSLIALYPEEAEVYMIRGQIYEQGRNVKAALEMYRRSLEADTGFSQAVMSIGYAYSTLGNQEKAVDYMQRYIRMAPDAADPRASYADLLVRAGRYQDALEQYRASLALKPDYWYAEREIGTVYLTLGRLREAEGQYERSLRLLPDLGRHEAARLRVRGSIALYRAQREDAVVLFRQSADRDSSLLNVSYGLCVALSRLRRFAEAHEVITQVERELLVRNLTQGPAMQGFHLMRARVLTEEGNLKEARRACENAFEFSSPLSRGAVFAHIARIDLAAGEWEAALDAVDEALKVNPNTPEILLTLTRIYSAKQDRRMTAEIGRRLLELWKDADSDFSGLLEVKQLLRR
jgi:tetratricopeptide (TPR) repeat protein